MGNRLGLQMKLLLKLYMANLLFQIDSILADSCTFSNTCRTCRECSGVSNKFYVMQSGTVKLTCDGDSGNNPWFHITETSNISIIRGTSRYGGSGNWLEISVVVPEDEGRYECQVGDSLRTAGCVFVLGMRVFAYCNVHYHPEVCGEQVSVQAGSTIVFDTRVVFINSGPCGLQENTERLYFYKGQALLYKCSARDNPCPETYLSSSIRAVRGEGNKFNLNLTKAYATVDDEALYTVSTFKNAKKIFKRFIVTVEALFAVLATSYQNVTVDRDLGKPVLVASRVGGQVTLFAVVTADSCPTVQWRVNRSAISHGDAGYIVGNPCRSHGSYTGTSTFNFTLTITANSATAGTYNATLTNAVGTREVPDVFVTPPVPVVITEIQLLSDPHCLVNGTSVNIKCVNSGFPRPEIVFLKGTEQITPGTGNFSNFEAVEGEFDTVRLTTARQEDGGEYVCVSMMRSTELDRSLPNTLLFCTLPSIVDLPAPMTHMKGHGFLLICSFTGVPLPNILWEKDGSVFLLGEGRRVINSTGKSQLEINSLAFSDAGLYSCSVTNVAGTDMRSVRLKVEAPPPITVPLPITAPTSTTAPPPITFPPPITVLSPNTTQLPTTAPPTTQPRVLYWTIACIIVATITGLMLLIAALFCGILVAGRVLKHRTPVASPCVSEIPLYANIAYKSYDDEDEPADNRSYERLDEYKA